MDKDMTFSRMLEIQRELQEKHAGEWRTVTPENAHFSFMWALGEMGEVIQIFKKRGAEEIMSDKEVRAHFVEEMTDVYMYMADVLNCLDVTPEEIADAYEAKHAYNMKRDYAKQSIEMFDKDK